MEKVKKIEKKILKKLQKTIENKLVIEKERILIAFSGGPDSVFLYYFLNFSVFLQLQKLFHIL